MTLIVERNEFLSKEKCERVSIMSSEANLYRTENYQNYINSFHRKSRVEKSISDFTKKIDDDNESINSVAESLNNYLDVKVCIYLLSSLFVWLALSRKKKSSFWFPKLKGLGFCYKEFCLINCLMTTN